MDFLQIKCFCIVGIIALSGYTSSQATGATDAESSDTSCKEAIVHCFSLYQEYLVMAQTFSKKDTKCYAASGIMKCAYGLKCADRAMKREMKQGVREFIQDHDNCDLSVGAVTRRMERFDQDSLYAQNIEARCLNSSKSCGAAYASKAVSAGETKTNKELKTWFCPIFYEYLECMAQDTCMTQESLEQVWDNLANTTVNCDDSDSFNRLMDMIKETELAAAEAAYSNEENFANTVHLSFAIFCLTGVYQFLLKLL